MLTPAQLERASQAYRRGYLDGYDGREPAKTISGNVFALHDYEEGYRAGKNDAEWARKRSHKE